MKNEVSVWSYLFRPFRYVAGARSLIIGLATMVLLAVLGYASGTHFNGVLDIHYSCMDQASPFSFHILYQIISWFCVVGIFYLSACIFSGSKVRLIDMAGTLAMARIPLLIAAAWGFIPAVHFCSMQEINTLDISGLLLMLKENAGWIALTLLILLPVVVWNIVLMYNAYTVSGYLKGVKGILSFIAALFVSEVLSLVLIYVGLKLIA